MQHILVGHFLFITASFFRQGFFYSLNTGDKLRSSDLDGLRQLHPLVRRRAASSR